MAETAADHLRHVLLLQGGGALGAYQAGAFEGLASHRFQPDWVIGVSIGAINAAIIAGNRPEHRVSRLREFWDRITAPTAALRALPLLQDSVFERSIGAAHALLRGQPNFFAPRPAFEWFTSSPISFYDTASLRATLEDLIDFDLINARKVRLSLGAVQVESGNNIYFDNKTTTLTADHVMASGALPPGFPAVTIGGRAYWDGGMVSNTPLSYLMDDNPRHDSLVFQIDLFPAAGKTPATLDEVAERSKDIQYSSRTRMITDEERRKQNLRRQVGSLIGRLPPELQQDAAVKALRAYACATRIDVVHLIYRPAVPQGAQKDYQFDRSSAERRWREGENDARAAMTAAPWRAPCPENTGMRTFDVATGRSKT